MAGHTSQWHLKVLKFCTCFKTFMTWCTNLSLALFLILTQNVVIFVYKKVMKSLWPLPILTVFFFHPQSDALCELLNHSLLPYSQVIIFPFVFFQQFVAYIESCCCLVCYLGWYFATSRQEKKSSLVACNLGQTSISPFVFQLLLCCLMCWYYIFFIFILCNSLLLYFDGILTWA